MTFDAKARISKSRAAIERAQESAGKNKKQVHGRYFIAEPRVMDDGGLPTRDEWIQEQAAKRGNETSVSKFGNTSERQQVTQGRK